MKKISYKFLIVLLMMIFVFSLAGCKNRKNAKFFYAPVGNLFITGNSQRMPFLFAYSKVIKEFEIIDVKTTPEVVFDYDTYPKTEKEKKTEFYKGMYFDECSFIFTTSDSFILESFKIVINGSDVRELNFNIKFDYMNFDNVEEFQPLEIPMAHGNTKIIDWKLSATKDIVITNIYFVSNIENDKRLYINNVLFFEERPFFKDEVINVGLRINEDWEITAMSYCYLEIFYTVGEESKKYTVGPTYLESSMETLKKAIDQEIK